MEIQRPKAILGIPIVLFAWLLAALPARDAHASRERETCYNELVAHLRDPRTRASAERFLKLRARIALSRLAWGLIQRTSRLNPRAEINADFLEDQIRDALNAFNTAGARDQVIADLREVWERTPYQGRRNMGQAGLIRVEQHNALVALEQQRTAKIQERERLSRDLLRNGLDVLRLNGEIDALTRRIQEHRNFRYHLTEEDMKLFDVLGQTVQRVVELPESVYSAPGDTAAKDRIIRHLEREITAANQDLTAAWRQLNLPLHCMAQPDCVSCRQGLPSQGLPGISELLQAALQNEYNQDAAGLYLMPYSDFTHRLDLPALHRNVADVQDPVSVIQGYINRQRTADQAAPRAALQAANQLALRESRTTPGRTQAFLQAWAASTLQVPDARYFRHGDGLYNTRTGAEVASTRDNRAREMVLRDFGSGEGISRLRMLEHTWGSPDCWMALAVAKYNQDRAFSCQVGGLAGTSVGTRQVLYELRNVPGLPRVGGGADRYPVEVDLQGTIEEELLERNIRYQRPRGNSPADYLRAVALLNDDPYYVSTDGISVDACSNRAIDTASGSPCISPSARDQGASGERVPTREAEASAGEVRRYIAARPQGEQQRLNLTLERAIAWDTHHGGRYVEAWVRAIREGGRGAANPDVPDLPAASTDLPANTFEDDIDAAEYVRRYIATRPSADRAGLNTALLRAIESDRANGGRQVEAWAQAIRENQTYFSLHARVNNQNVVLLRRVSTGLDVDPVAVARANFPEALNLTANVNFHGFSESCQRAYVGARINNRPSYSCYEPFPPVVGVPTLFLYRVADVPRAPTAFVRGDIREELRRRDREYRQPSGDITPHAIFRLEALQNRQIFFVDATGASFDTLTDREVTGPFRRVASTVVTGERPSLRIIQAHIRGLRGEQQTAAARSLREMLTLQADQQGRYISAWAAVIEGNRNVQPPRRRVEYFNVTSHAGEGSVQVRNAVTGVAEDPQRLIREFGRQANPGAWVNLELTGMPVMSPSCQSAFASARQNRQDYYACYDRNLIDAARNQNQLRLFRVGQVLPVDDPRPELLRLLEGELTLQEISLAAMVPREQRASGTSQYCATPPSGATANVRAACARLRGIQASIAEARRTQGSPTGAQIMRLVALSSHQPRYADLEGNYRDSSSNELVTEEVTGTTVAAATLENPRQRVEAHIGRLSDAPRGELPSLRELASGSLYVMSQARPSDRGDYVESWARSLSDGKAYFPVLSRGVSGIQLRYYHTQTGTRVNDPREFVRAHLNASPSGPAELQANLRTLAQAPSDMFVANWAMAIRNQKGFFLGGSGDAIRLYDTRTGQVVTDYLSLLRERARTALSASVGFNNFSPSCQAAYTASRLNNESYYGCHPRGSDAPVLFRMEGFFPQRVEDVHDLIERQLTRLNVAHDQVRGPVTPADIQRAIALSNGLYLYSDGSRFVESGSNIPVARLTPPPVSTARALTDAEVYLNRTPLDVEARYRDQSVDRDQFTRPAEVVGSGEALNRLDDEQTIVEWHQRYGASRGSVCESGNYSIIDKQNSRVRVYNNDGRMIWERPVLIGTERGDQRTRWRRYSPGGGGRGTTNQRTGAGVYGILEIRNQSKYHMNTYAGNLFALFDGTTGEEIAVMAAHRTPVNAVNREARLAAVDRGEDVSTRMTNGCINFSPDDFTAYRQYVDTGCRFYVLPENSDVRTHLAMSVRDGDVRLDVNIRSPQDVVDRVLRGQPDPLSNFADRDGIERELRSLAEKNPATQRPWQDGGEFHEALTRRILGETVDGMLAAQPGILASFRDGASRERFRQSLNDFMLANPATNRPWATPAEFQTALVSFIRDHAPGSPRAVITPAMRLSSRQWTPIWRQLAASSWPRLEDFETPPPAPPRAIEINVDNAGGLDVLASAYRFHRYNSLRSDGLCADAARFTSQPRMRDYVITDAARAARLACRPGTTPFDNAAYARDYMDELPDRQTVINEFVGTLVEQKEEMMSAYGLNNNDYNDLALLSYAILGQETEFGQSWRYVMKRMIDDRGGDAATRTWRRAQDRGGLELAGLASQSLIDANLYFFGMGDVQGITQLDRTLVAPLPADPVEEDRCRPRTSPAGEYGARISQGLTQIKRIPDMYFLLRMRSQLAEVRATNPTCPARDRDGLRIEDCAIHVLREQTDGRILRDPRESAYATMAYLAESLRNLRTRAGRNAAEDVGSVLDGDNLSNFMAYAFNGGMRQVTGAPVPEGCPQDSATPERNQYTQRLRQYLGQLVLTQALPAEIRPQRRVCVDGACGDQTVRPATPGR